MEFDPLTDAEIEHGAVRAHLIEKSKPSYYFVIQLDELIFGKGININVVHSGLPLTRYSYCIEFSGLATRFALLSAACAGPAEVYRFFPPSRQRIKLHIGHRKIFAVISQQCAPTLDRESIRNPIVES